jgi:hypothetical protein
MLRDEETGERFEPYVIQPDPTRWAPSLRCNNCAAAITRVVAIDNAVLYYDEDGLHTCTDDGDD